MKVLFIHDHKISVRDNKLYSNGSFSKDVVNRYLSVFDSITFATRLKDDLNLENLTLIGDRTEIGYIPMKNLATINLSNYFDNFRTLSRIIPQFDFVIFRLPSLIGIMGLKIASKCNVPYAIEIVGCAKDTYKLFGGIKGLLISYPMFLLTRKYAKYSSNTLYVTKNFLQLRYPSLAENQVECSNAEIVLNDNALLNRISFSSQEKSVIKLGMIGALGSKYKGFDTSIKAVAKLIELGHKNYVLEIVGGGNRNQIQKTIEEYKLSKYVSFVGTLSHPDGIFNWLDEIDIYLHPSRTEGLPRALIEAMSRACPCIGTNVGGISELLEKEFLLEIDDFNRLTDLVLKLKELNVTNEQSQINFKNSKNYTKDVLDIKRTSFYKRAIAVRHN